MTSSGSRLLVLIAFVSSAIRDLNIGSVLGVPMKGMRSRTRPGESSDQTQTQSSDARFICPVAKETTRLNSFLWAVEGRLRPSFFFGTIHVPYTRVWNYIPSNAKAAFRQSDALQLELDLLDPDTISALHRCQLLPHGKSIADVIPQSLYLRLKRHLQYVKVSMASWLTPTQRGQGIYADYLFDALTGNWERKRPIYVMMMINSLTEADVRLRGTPVLDLFLAQEARRLKKRRGAVEKVEEHCLPLNEMNLSQVVFALNRTLWNHELRRPDSSFDLPWPSPVPTRSSSSSLISSDDLVHHYNCGDLNAVLFSRDSAQVPNLLQESSNGSSSSTAQGFSTYPGSFTQDEETAKEIDDYFREELIFKRNEKMAERVDQLLTMHPKISFFFAFGAGHFIGNNSVIEILQRKGYNISHTPPSESAESRTRPRTRHDRRKLDQNHFLSMTDRPVTDSLHLRRSQFNDLWIRLDDDGFDIDGFVRNQLQRNIQASTTTTAEPRRLSAVLSSSSSAAAAAAAASVPSSSLSAAKAALVFFISAIFVAVT